MKDYIEKTLHCPVAFAEYHALRKLPLSILGNYKLSTVTIAGNRCIFAMPLSDINFSAIRKHWKQIEKLTGEICVLSFRKMNAYAKDHMIDEGIPFVVENKQIYLPFLGLALSERADRIIKPCEQMSFLTQKLLLLSIYEKWKEVSVSEAAEKLRVTKTSVTRCYDEIEALELPYIKKRSRSRIFSADDDLQGMWEKLKKVFRTPVLQQFFLKEDLKKKEMLGGLSALGYYSMLDDNPYPIYAIPKKEIGELLRENEQIRPQDDMPGCILQEVGYTIDFGNGKAVDPLSLFLMLTDREMDDPRVEKAVEEMLEEEVWSKA